MLTRLFSPTATDRSLAFFENLTDLARETGLIVNNSRKFSAQGFLLALIKGALSGKASLRQLASRLGGFEPLSMTKQGFDKRIKPEAIAFLLATLAALLKTRFIDKTRTQNSLAQKFGRVLVEDSVVHRLHPSNADHSPGHGNGRSKTSVLKVDVTLDLFSGECVSSSLHGGTEQDKELGKDLVDLVTKDDLVMRDMGYFIIEEFVIIEEKGGYWLSRVPANVIVTDKKGRKIEKVLGAHTGEVWDRKVLVGAEQKHEARLVAVRAQPEVVRKNLKEAEERADRHGRTLTKEQRERCHWHLIVTNIEKSNLAATEISKLYRCRWNIEILFRAWKQGMNMGPALNHRSNPEHLQALILAAMIYKAFTVSVMKGFEQTRPARERLSIEKMFDEMGDLVLRIQRLDEWTDLKVDPRHLLMESRKDRKTLMDTWMQIKS